MEVEMASWDTRGCMVELTGRVAKVQCAKRVKKWRTAVGDAQLVACREIATHRQAEVVVHSYFHFQWRDKSCVLDIYPTTQGIFLASGCHEPITGLEHEWDLFDAVCAIAGSDFGVKKPDTSHVEPPTPKTPEKPQKVKVKTEAQIHKQSQKKERRRENRMQRKSHRSEWPMLRVDPTELGYYKYIQSPEWRLKRAAALYHYGEKCCSCGVKRDLQVHHKHYRTLGREAMRDLEVLCRNCHSAVHEKEGKLPMDGVSREFRQIVG